MKLRSEFSVVVEYEKSVPFGSRSDYSSECAYRDATEVRLRGRVKSGLSWAEKILVRKSAEFLTLTLLAFMAAPAGAKEMAWHGTMSLEFVKSSYSPARITGGGVATVNGSSGGFAGGTELGDGLVLLGARVYDSYAGRFLSPHFLFNELNQSTYTLGNPIDFWDPSGLSVRAAKNRVLASTLQEVAVGLGAVAGFVAFFNRPAAAAIAAVAAAAEAASAHYANEANKADLEEELQNDSTEGVKQAPRGFDALEANDPSQGRFASSELGSFSGASIGGGGLGGELPVMTGWGALPGACPEAPLASVQVSGGLRPWLSMLVVLQLLLGILVLSRLRVGQEKCDDQVP